MKIKKNSTFLSRLIGMLLILGTAALVFPSCGDGGKGNGEDADVDVDVPVDFQLDPDSREDPGTDPVPDDAVPDGISDPDAVEDLLPDQQEDTEEDMVEEEVVGGCEDEIAAIATETGIVGSCSAIVRLDYTTRTLIGWQLVCGAYATLNEAEARDQAQMDTGYGLSGSMLNPPDPEDEYVFYQAPGDFGGAASVSARNGKSVFGGSIIWMGTGEITYPTTWRPVSELGSDCPRLPHTVSVTSYDLAAGGTTIDPSDIAAVTAVVWATALPEGMMTSGYIFDAVLLLYPRSVGAFDPSTAEWIFILNGGWLE